MFEARNWVRWRFRVLIVTSLLPGCQLFLIAWHHLSQIEVGFLLFPLSSPVCISSLILLFQCPCYIIPRWYPFHSILFSPCMSVLRCHSFSLSLTQCISLLLKWKCFSSPSPSINQSINIYFRPQFFSLLHLPNQAQSRNNTPMICGNVPPIILKIFNCIC